MTATGTGASMHVPHTSSQPTKRPPKVLTVAVGSTNQVKVSAVKECLASYEDTFEYVEAGVQLEVEAYSVSTGVADQPMTLEETAR